MKAESPSKTASGLTHHASLREVSPKLLRGNLSKETAVSFMRVAEERQGIDKSDVAGSARQ